MKQLRAGVACVYLLTYYVELESRWTFSSRAGLLFTEGRKQLSHVHETSQVIHETI